MGLLKFFHRESDLGEEIQVHLAMAIRDRIDRGEDPTSAELAARREFGNPTVIREHTREAWSWNWLEQAWRDIRYALRGLRANPAFTTVAVASLALGIGANTAVFSLMYPVMLRSLPVSHPEQLVELLEKYPGEPRGNGYWTEKSYQHYRDNNKVFSTLIGTGIDNLLSVRTQGFEPETVVGEFVTGNYFSALGLAPTLGRLIGPDDKSGASSAVISWSYWDSRYHQDRTIVGRELTVHGNPVTIIGVAPKEFVGLRVDAETTVWLTSGPGAQYALLGRLRPGVTVAQARSEMALLFRFTIEERASQSIDPLVRRLKVEVEPAGAGLSIVRDRFGRPLTVLMAIVAILLCLACANLAGLLTARGASRTREVALRLGLGASRGAIIRQALTESLMLAVMGALAGLAVAYFGAEALERIIASGRPLERFVLDVHPDGGTLAFMSAVVIAVGFGFGLAPAWSALRVTPARALWQSGAATQTRANRLVWKTLLVTQVALSVLLLSTGATFVMDLQSLRGTDLGFRRDHVLLVTLDSPSAGYSGERLPAAYQELLSRLQAIPAVRSASLSDPTPLSGAGAAGFGSVEGFEERPEDRRWISISWIGPKYFETLGTPLLAGRQFSFQEHSGVAIINQTLARQYFDGRDPIGKTITMDHVTGTREPSTYVIVGVAADANYSDIHESDRRAIYLPAFRGGRVEARTFVIRTDVEPMSIAGAARETVREVAPGITVKNITTLAGQIDSSIVPERLLAALSAVFAALGALLSGIGIYGLLAHTVARRTNEIGVRIAFGADPSRVATMVLMDAIGVVGVGLAIGVPVSFVARKLAGAIIPGLTPAPVTSLGLGVAAILGVAVLASFVPARRAVRVDPMECLRHE